MEITPELIDIITQQVLKVLNGTEIVPCEDNREEVLVWGPDNCCPIDTEKYKKVMLYAKPDELDVAKPDILKYKALIITELCQMDLCDIAIGRPGSLLTQLVSEALLCGIPVFVLESGITYTRFKSTANAGYYQMLNGYVQKITNFGIKVAHVTDIERLLDKPKSSQSVKLEEPVHTAHAAHPVQTKSCEKPAQKSKSKLLSAETIMEAVSKGNSKIVVPKGTIVTPLAKDLMRDRKLQLVYGQE